MIAPDDLADLDADAPTVVSVSDVHGHRDSLESALRTLADHPDFGSIVDRCDDEGLHWTGGHENVLVVDGDLVDRGPDSQACLELIWQLQRQAPVGHVRYLLGNHELYLVFPSPPEWDRWFTGTVDDGVRRRFLERVLTGEVAVAFEGYRYTYVHAGAPGGVDVAGLNVGLRAAATDLRDRVGDDDERAAFRRAFRDHCPAVYREADEDTPVREDPDAGVVWLDFSYLPADAPPQVVGHTPQATVTRRGNVVCHDVVLPNADSPGGEAVLVETPDALRELVRDPDGGVTVRDV